MLKYRSVDAVTGLFLRGIHMAENEHSNWLIRVGDKAADEGYWIRLKPEVGLCYGVHAGDGVLLEKDNRIIAVATVYLRRYESCGTMICFERIRRANSNEIWTSLVENNGQTIQRLTNDTFDHFLGSINSSGLEALLPLWSSVADDKTAQASVRRYMRRLMVWAAHDDLLGPCGGPEEELLNTNVRDRYPLGKLAPKHLVQVYDEDNPSDERLQTDDGRGSISHDNNDVKKESKPSSMTEDEPDEDVTDAKTRLAERMTPSSMGLTFYIKTSVHRIHLQLSWGIYRRQPAFEKEYIDKKTGEYKTAKIQHWKREPRFYENDIDLYDHEITPDASNPKIQCRIRLRPLPEKDIQFVSIFLINNQTETKRNRDETWLFQPKIRLTGVNGDPIVCPGYHEHDKDDDLLALEMMYRNQVEFARGHGVSVHVDHGELRDPSQACAIETDYMPEYEIPYTDQPNAKDDPVFARLRGFFDMKKMAEMSKPEHRDELIAGLRDFADAYRQWIECQSQIPVDEIYRDACDEVTYNCEKTLNRLLDGIETLETDDRALKAFCFMNLAMYEQRLHTLAIRQNRERQENDFRIALDEVRQKERIAWRPFQVAFILLSVPSLANPLHRDRVRTSENGVDMPADLLWFPTGGGKTEAYLGVAAFAMAIRRLHGPLGNYENDEGLCVFMRYTLRLLTVQQLQRAAALVCAMEHIRREYPEIWGEKRFTLGIWIGSKATPNKTEDAAKVVEEKRANKYLSGPLPNQLTHCPWCGAPIDESRDIECDCERIETHVYCGDSHSECEFCKRDHADGLPILTVDEEIYHRPPTMLIATVDKFAQMAWQDDAETLFGRASGRCERHGLVWPDCESCKGSYHTPKDDDLPRAEIIRPLPRPIRPPDLIIQDEFHLISGPLGTLVGLYETAIDELCCWDLEGHRVHAKVIASTATVRCAEDQMRKVFNRTAVIFPPHGINADDNFFSRQRPPSEHSGRLYLGISAPGSAHTALSVRVYVAFLTAAKSLFNHFGCELADTYLTLVGYFNALRSLSGMRRRCEDVIYERARHVDQVTDTHNRPARIGLEPRKLRSPLELTSRVSSTNIPKTLGSLEVPFSNESFVETPPETKNNRKKGTKLTLAEMKAASKADAQNTSPKAVDIVLATNMLSVGVDVNRLGLMVVDGQPKNTSEYIQATSRVGRQYPGLVVTMLNWARPRDFSHYENFESYHAAFYKYVEAQSVTPFSKRALDRGLTGLLVSLIRMSKPCYAANDSAEKARRMDRETRDSFIKSIASRAYDIDCRDKKNEVSNMIDSRMDAWLRDIAPNSFVCYRKHPKHDRVAIIKSPGAMPWDDSTVPNTMREVEPDVPLIIPEGAELLDRRIDDEHPWQTASKE